jgi:hypothetical protein
VEREPGAEPERGDLLAVQSLVTETQLDDVRELLRNRRGLDQLDALANIACPVLGRPM